MSDDVVSKLLDRIEKHIRDNESQHKWWSDRAKEWSDTEAKVRSASDELNAKLLETEQELQRLRQRHVEVQSEEVAAARAEIETLKDAMAADDQRLRDAEERIWPGKTWGCDAPDKMADEILHLRQQLANAQRELSEQGQAHSVELQRETYGLSQQLDAALASLTGQRLNAEERDREIGRLQVFVAEVRQARDNYQWPDSWDAILGALAELDAATQPAPVAEPARCPECERLQLAMNDSDERITNLVQFVEKVRPLVDMPRRPMYPKDVDFVRAALAQLDAGTEPTPVAEHAGGGA